MKPAIHFFLIKYLVIKSGNYSNKYFLRAYIYYAIIARSEEVRQPMNVSCLKILGIVTFYNYIPNYNYVHCILLIIYKLKLVCFCSCVYIMLL